MFEMQLSHITERPAKQKYILYMCKTVIRQYNHTWQLYVSFED